MPASADDPAPPSEANLAGYAERIAEDGQTASFDPQAARDIFCNCCRNEDAAWAAGQLRPQPLAVYQDPVKFADERFGRVPRVDIETLRDRAIDPAYQKKMHSCTPCRQIITLDTDPSPLLAMPEAFAKVLIGLI